MVLKLEVKKLESRDTKEDPVPVWCVATNPELLSEMLSCTACSGGGGC